MPNIYIYIYMELEDEGVMFLTFLSWDSSVFGAHFILVLHDFCLIIVVMNRK